MRGRHSRCIAGVLLLALLLLDGCAAASGPTLLPTPQAPSAAASPVAVLPVATGTGALDALMQQQATATSFSGSVLVARGGTILLRQAYGLANVELHVPNGPETEFRIGSVTKQFTAMAILILQERGKLNVTDAICKYVPNCPSSWQPMTIHHLLTHESGLPGSPSDQDAVAASAGNWTPEQWLPRIEAQPLQFTPGSKYVYGNLDYLVLSAVIDRASGQKFADFLQAAILGPLGMQHTGLDPAGFAPYPILPGRASGYVHIGKDLEHEPFEDVAVSYGSGGLYSTVDDLYRWDQALSTEQLVPKALLDQMFTPYLSNIGYGWELGSLNGHKTEVAAGTLPGFRSLIGRMPDEQLTVIMLDNTDIGVDTLSAAAQLLALRAIGAS